MQHDSFVNHTTSTTTTPFLPLESPILDDESTNNNTIDRYTPMTDEDTPQIYVSMGSHEQGYEVPRGGGGGWRSSHHKLRRRNVQSSKHLGVQTTLFDLERQGGGDENEDVEDNNNTAAQDGKTYGSINDSERERMDRAKSLKNSMEEFLRQAASESQSFRRKLTSNRLAPNERSGSTSSGTLNLSPYERLEAFIEHEFPTKDQVPSTYDLINVGDLEPNRSRYKPGDWVEIEGLDMRWRVDMITRVIKEAPDDWDWNAPQNEGKEPEWKFTYNAGDERNIKEEDLRSPEEGLKTLFGTRPWLWQQWAILKVEEKLRFQEGHQDDFMEKDIQKLAAGEWVL